MEIAPYWTAISAAVVLLCAGMYLLITQKVIGAGANVEVEVTHFGKLKTNYPAGLAIVVGASLIGYTVHLLAENAKERYKSTPKNSRVSMSGTIRRAKGPPHNGIMVGVVPGNMVATDNDGNYTLQFDGGDGSYAAVALDPLPNSPPPLVQSIVMKGNHASFSHSFGCVSEGGGTLPGVPCGLSASAKRSVE